MHSEFVDSLPLLCYFWIQRIQSLFGLRYKMLVLGSVLVHEFLRNIVNAQYCVQYQVARAFWNGAVSFLRAAIGAPDSVPNVVYPLHHFRLAACVEVVLPGCVLVGLAGFPKRDASL